MARTLKAVILLVKGQPASQVGAAIRKGLDSLLQTDKINAAVENHFIYPWFSFKENFNFCSPRTPDKFKDHCEQAARSHQLDAPDDHLTSGDSTEVFFIHELAPIRTLCFEIFQTK